MAQGPQQTAVLLIVGLTESLLEHAPRLRAFRDRNASRRLTPEFPAVTCTVQSSMLTGEPPREHGIVGNGWFDRDLAEIQFWKQSNMLVRADKVWETARRRDPSVTCANICWWYNMATSADISITPRPIYKADGRKIPDCYTNPADLREELTAKLGAFPLFHFWGPLASIVSTRWIAKAAMHTFERFSPTLSLVYLPHLDYPLQKLGPDHPKIPAEVAAVDDVAAELIRFYQRRNVRLIIASEYAIEAVDGPVHINRALRRAGLLRVREEDGGELLDPIASSAFAVSDHQIAHIYVRDPERLGDARAALADLEGVGRVLTRNEQRGLDLDHPRGGDLIAIASPRRWFTYYHWLDDDRAPDYARTVDIHRKPGYDPCELFIDPRFRSPRLALAARLARKELGFRVLMDLIPLDASLVRGSHGRPTTSETPLADRPIVLAETRLDGHPGEIHCRALRDLILATMFYA